uniref:PARP alpha-helical domain-containing protein n=1 Tax=Magnetococcus massalia (strain MO-1) TaxID=451514 RepID=A0A1S7LE61_MAGMO|nr:Conserved protein of unknown function. Putative Chromosome segregation ATPases-like protein [Candidatus Magnetococcus massalia]
MSVVVGIHVSENAPQVIAAAPLPDFLANPLGNQAEAPIVMTLLGVIGGFLTYFMIAYVFQALLDYVRVGMAHRSLTRAMKRGEFERGEADPEGYRWFYYPLFTRLWHDFTDSLHRQVVVDEHGAKHVHFRATVPSELYFNLQNMVDTPMRVEFFRHLPGILTGAGIVSTFAGILLGLNDFNPTVEASQVTQQLKHLFTGVSTAFVASFIAIATAISVTTLEKLLIHWRYSQITRLQGTLDDLFHGGVESEYLAEIAARGEGEDELSEAATAVGDSGAAAHALREALAEPVRRMADAVDSAAQQQVAQGESLARMEKLLEGLAQPLTSGLEGVREGVTQSMTEFSGGLNAMAESQQKLVQQLESAQQAAASAVDATTAEQAETPALPTAPAIDAVALGQSMEELARAVKRLAKREQHETDTVELLMAQNRADSEALREELIQLGERLAEEPRALQQGVADISQDLTEQVSDQLQASVSTMGQDLAAPLAEMVAQQQQWQQSSQQFIAEMSGQRELLSAIKEQLSATPEGQQAMAQSQESSRALLVESAEQVIAIRELLAEVKEALLQREDARGDQQQVLLQVMTQLDENLSKGQAQREALLMARIAQEQGDLATQMQEMLDTGIQAMEGRMENLLDSMQRVEKDQGGHLEQLRSSQQDINSQLDLMRDQGDQQSSDMEQLRRQMETQDSHFETLQSAQDETEARLQGIETGQGQQMNTLEGAITQLQHQEAVLAESMDLLHGQSAARGTLEGLQADQMALARRLDLLHEEQGSGFEQLQQAFEQQREALVGQLEGMDDLRQDQNLIRKAQQQGLERTDTLQQLTEAIHALHAERMGRMRQTVKRRMDRLATTLEAANEVTNTQLQNQQAAQGTLLETLQQALQAQAGSPAQLTELEEALRQLGERNEHLDSQQTRRLEGVQSALEERLETLVPHDYGDQLNLMADHMRGLSALDSSEQLTAMQDRLESLEPYDYSDQLAALDSRLDGMQPVDHSAQLDTMQARLEHLEPHDYSEQLATIESGLEALTPKDYSEALEALKARQDGQVMLLEGLRSGLEKVQDTLKTRQEQLAKQRLEVDEGVESLVASLQDNLDVQGEVLLQVRESQIKATTEYTKVREIQQQMAETMDGVGDAQREATDALNMTRSDTLESKRFMESVMEAQGAIRNAVGEMGELQRLLRDGLSTIEQSQSGMQQSLESSQQQESVKVDSLADTLAHLQMQQSALNDALSSHKQLGEALGGQLQIVREQQSKDSQLLMNALEGLQQALPTGLPDIVDNLRRVLGDEVEGRTRALGDRVEAIGSSLGETQEGIRHALTEVRGLLDRTGAERDARMAERLESLGEQTRQRHQAQMNALEAVSGRLAQRTEMLKGHLDQAVEKMLGQLVTGQSSSDLEGISEAQLKQGLETLQGQVDRSLDGRIAQLREQVSDLFHGTMGHFADEVEQRTADMLKGSIETLEDTAQLLQKQAQQPVVVTDSESEGGAVVAPAVDFAALEQAVQNRIAGLQELLEGGEERADQRTDALAELIRQGDSEQGQKLERAIQGLAQEITAELSKSLGQTLGQMLGDDLARELAQSVGGQILAQVQGAMGQVDGRLQQLQGQLAQEQESMQHLLKGWIADNHNSREAQNTLNARIEEMVQRTENGHQGMMGALDQVSRNLSDDMVRMRENIEAETEATGNKVVRQVRNLLDANSEDQSANIEVLGERLDALRKRIKK